MSQTGPDLQARTVPGTVPPSQSRGRRRRTPGPGTVLGAEGVLSAGLRDERMAMSPTCPSPALSSSLCYPNAYCDPTSRRLMGAQNLGSLGRLFLPSSCQKRHRLSPRHQAPNKLLIDRAAFVSLTHTRVVEQRPPKCVQKTPGPRRSPLPSSCSPQSKASGSRDGAHASPAGAPAAARQAWEPCVRLPPPGPALFPTL